MSQQPVSPASSRVKTEVVCDGTSGSFVERPKRPFQDFERNETAEPSTKRARRLLQRIRPAQPIYPASQCAQDGVAHKKAPKPERHALRQLVDAWLSDHPLSDGTPEYIMLELNDFTIYHPERSHNNNGFDRSLEMESLLVLNAKRGVDELLLDGVLSYRGLSFALERAHFSTCTIDGYFDLSIPTVEGRIALQSTVARGVDDRIWYTLGRPANRYARFHEPFLWVADLSKHFMEYLSEHEQAVLRDFRSEFYTWLRQAHPDSPEVKAWIDQVGFTDFRQAVVANWEFLWKEHYGLEGASLWERPIWRELNADRLTAVPPQPRVETKTIVTPLVHDCFKRMYFGDQLKTVQISSKLAKQHADLKSSMGFLDVPTISASQSIDEIALQHARAPQKPVKRGDIVAIRRDEKSLWRDAAALWYAYVQGVRPINHSTKQCLNVIWLYRPSDTTLGSMYYPIQNELFLSDNCNCGDGLVKEDDVVFILKASRFPKTGHILLRQKYLTEDHAFVTLSGSDLSCCHRAARAGGAYAKAKAQYSVGDTAYLRVDMQQSGSREDEELDPVVITGFDEERARIRVQTFKSRGRDLGDTTAAANELIWTDFTVAVPPSRIVERCYVRVFPTASVVCAPYNRGGCGHFWFITKAATSCDSKRLRPVPDDIDKYLRQGYVPGDRNSSIPLKGLSIFSGGGNFDRGIEDSGAVDFHWAVEIDPIPMHTYHANLSHGKATKLFLGSVDDSLKQALEGSQDQRVAPLGQVEAIGAGSPCRAFSSAQRDRLSARSLKNASLVASVAAHVDFYRPKYAFLENVSAMANTVKVLNGDNVFSQLLCCLVSMGYQVRQFNLDAWSCGAGQSRSRLFVSIAAPGLPPVEHPLLSHAHPRGTVNKSLGLAANGETFGDRMFGPTPFPCVTARAAVADLPDIGDARVGSCVESPDHRMPIGYNNLTRIMVQNIPILPRNASLRTAMDLGILPPPQVDLARNWNSKIRTASNSKSWSRVNPDRPFPAITRRLTPADGFAGTTLHWEQHRTLTVMEARRAQGYPDGEVLIGRARDQWAAVGDAVCRQVALALGVRLREAWYEAQSQKGRRESLDPFSISTATHDAEATEDSSPEANVTSTVQVIVSGQKESSNCIVQVAKYVQSPAAHGTREGYKPDGVEVSVRARSSGKWSQRALVHFEAMLSTAK